MNQLSVQKYLHQHGLSQLVTNYDILVKDYPAQNLIVLNYNQCDSPKNDPITNECRGLILNRDTFEVVSRAFDRFYNYGECAAEPIDVSKCSVHEKLDGSLLKLLFHQDMWHCSTRGTAFAESDVNGWGITFAELVHRALGLREGDHWGFSHWCFDNNLVSDYTYICELTSIENRVVRKYQGTSLYLLAVRDNATGEYVEPDINVQMLFSLPQTYEFDTIEHCLKAVKELPNLEEGYVLYNKHGEPLCKIKNPAYVAAHHLRSEGLNPKRLAQLVLMNEVDEYLSVYPEDEEHFQPYLDRYSSLIEELYDLWIENRHIEDQKEFALKVKDHPCSAVIFKARGSGLIEPNLVYLFHQQTEAFQLRAMRVK